MQRKNCNTIASNLQSDDTSILSHACRTWSSRFLGQSENKIFKSNAMRYYYADGNRWDIPRHVWNWSSNLILKWNSFMKDSKWRLTLRYSWGATCGGVAWKRHGTWEHIHWHLDFECRWLIPQHHRWFFPGKHGWPRKSHELICCMKASTKTHEVNLAHRLAQVRRYQHSRQHLCLCSVVSTALYDQSATQYSQIHAVSTWNASW